jgi:hypothetical protein
VAAAEVHVRPGDRVEGDVRGRGHVVDWLQRAVAGTLAKKADERMEVVGRNAGAVSW